MFSRKISQFFLLFIFAPCFFLAGASQFYLAFNPYFEERMPFLHTCEVSRIFRPDLKENRIQVFCGDDQIPYILYTRFKEPPIIYGKRAVLAGFKNSKGSRDVTNVRVGGESYSGYLESDRDVGTDITLLFLGVFYMAIGAGIFWAGIDMWFRDYEIAERFEAPHGVLQEWSDKYLPGDKPKLPMFLFASALALWIFDLLSVGLIKAFLKLLVKVVVAKFFGQS